MSDVPIYLDYNATTPIDPRVAEAMRPFLHEHFGNPSSGHVFGRRAREAVEHARAQVAALLGAASDEIVFTSGGTESNNTAIRGAASRRPAPHFVTSSVEHPAVREPLRALEHAGAGVTCLPVDGAGAVAAQDAAAAIRADTVLVTVMHANNEVGTIQPIAGIAAAARERGVLSHTDAAQSVGKIAVRVDDLGVDLLTVAGHKLYAPKGVGALYIRRGTDLPSFLHGASHEAGRRAGTENVLEIVGLGRACELAAEHLEEGRLHARTLRERLWGRLLDVVPGVTRHGDPERGLPNTLSLAFPGTEASALLDRLGEHLAASAGAACHADGITISTVLEAMNVSESLARGTIRFSVGRPTTTDDVDRAARLVAQALRETGAC